MPAWNFTKLKANQIRMLPIIRKIRSYRESKIIFFVVADTLFIVLSIWIAFLLRFDGQIPSQYNNAIKDICVISLVIFLPVFYFQKLYALTWSYVSAQEFISLFKAMVISFLGLAVIVFAFRNTPDFSGFPRSVLVMYFLLVFAFCGILRFSKRIYLQTLALKKKFKKERTLIIGASDSGEQILRSILSSHNSPYLPVGFVDDSKVKQGVSIHGVKVLGRIDDLAGIIKNHQIRKVIVALPSNEASLTKKAVALSREAGIYKIKIVPPLAEIMKGNISFRNLKDVDIEDLLGRESVQLDNKLINTFIKGKKVLVTGGAGSIGSELCRQVLKIGPSLLVLLDNNETGVFTIAKELESNFPEAPFHPLIADVKDEKKIKEIFAQYKFDIVFHAAAYKHVPLMEENVDEAVKNNIFGTEILAKASVEAHVEKFIFISTDKAVNPTSVMGATKRFGEMICSAYHQKGITKFISVRFGNVLNSRGSVIPIFREQIRKGGPVEVTDPRMKRYFMLISEACLLVMQAGAMGQGGEVFVLDMGELIYIIDLAKEMIRLSGFEPDKDIAIIFTGMRPGEKLFEEILNAEEGTLATQNKSIFTAKLSAPDANEFIKDFESFKAMVITNNRDIIINSIKKIIPTFSGGQK